MGLSASQGRMLLLTARKSDLEFRAQQISQKRLLLSQQLEEIALEYENATSNRQMKIFLYSQTQDGTQDDNNTRTTNLTYAALISGTLTSGCPTDESGIQLGDYMNKPEFASTTAYRLVDPTGAIVVADVSEIPLSSTDTSTTRETTKADDSGIYTPKTYTYSGSTKPTNEEDYDNIESKGAYAVAATKNGNEETALGEFIKNNNLMKDGKIANVFYDNGMVQFQDEDGNYHYFNIKDGTEVDKNAEGFSFNEKSSQKLTMVKEASSIPQTEYVSKTSVDADLDDNGLEPGLDGKYRVTINGKERTYVVDPGLKAGVTDINASKTSPNYLQDCLRNGKYLLEQGNKNQETDKFEWKSISWDTTANISDGYYTEDDDKAKAKYDRLQQQIQNQDKKLEIELDNIETQRQAVTTEQESVKKVINENIEGSFNAFA